MSSVFQDSNFYLPSDYGGDSGAWAAAVTGRADGGGGSPGYGGYIFCAGMTYGSGSGDAFQSEGQKVEMSVRVPAAMPGAYALRVFGTTNHLDVSDALVGSSNTPAVGAMGSLTAYELESAATATGEVALNIAFASFAGGSLSDYAPTPSGGAGAAEKRTEVELSIVRGSWLGADGAIIGILTPVFDYP